METKKKLRKDLKELQVWMSNLANKVVELDAIVTTLIKAKEAEADIISGKEAAKLLGWASEKVSSTFLTRHGITFTKDENNILHISKKKLMEYIEKRNSETSKE